MRRFLETFFRRPLLFLVLLVLLPLIGVGVSYIYFPRTYQTTASLWAFRRYSIIGATGPESDLYATPAQTQATALTELLQSRTFALQVVKGIKLAPTLSLSSAILSDPQLLNDSLYNEISHHVLATSQGYNLYTVSYTNRDAQIAKQVVDATIHEFGVVGANFSIVEGQRLLANYQAELAQAQLNAEKAAAVQEQYLIDHPNLTRPGVAPLNDPKYALLDVQRVQAENAVQNLEMSISTINQEINTQGKNADSFFNVLDIPTVANTPLSRLKYYEVGAGIGAGIALVGWILYLLISMRRDRSVYTALDIQKVVSLPVVMQLPQLPVETVPLLLEQAMPRSIQNHMGM
ncbi:MAG TPA: hypothetical protein VEV19_14685 [Ktedonobacteraceae bacterium]|nr:hypothetical protein [Ktedonobacteraceae bacterium]